jgi:hypothetical protein
MTSLSLGTRTMAAKTVSVDSSYGVGKLTIGGAGLALAVVTVIVGSR